MLSINMDDVIKVLNSIKSQLIGFGVVAVLLIAVMIACRKQSKSKKYLIRWQAGLGMVLALAITVNLILTGPMYSMVTLATGGARSARRTWHPLPSCARTLPMRALFCWITTAPCPWPRTAS